MTAKRAGVSIALIAFAIITISASARANESAESEIVLVYKAPDGCADREGFIDAVRARTGAKVPTRYALSVAITKTRHFHGRLEAKDEHGLAFARDVEGRTCAEIVDALALALAMAVEPDEEEPTPSPPPAYQPYPVPTLEPQAPEKPVVLTTPPPEKQITIALGASGLAVGGYTPVVAAGGQVFGEIEEFGLSARLGAAFAESNPVTRGADADQTQASFLWGAGVLDLCGALVKRPQLSAWGCGRFEAGALQSSSSVTGQSLDTHVWLALGIGVRGRWIVAGPFFLELEPWLSAPLIGEHYIFHTVTSVHDVPVVVGGAAMSAGFLFSR